MEHLFKEIVDHFEDIFEGEWAPEVEDRASITPSSSFRDTVYWDSLGTLSVIVMLSDNYGVSVTPKQINEELVSYQDLIDLIKS